MNVWKLTAAGNLVKTEEEIRPEEGKRRIRVTKLFVNSEDAAIVKGLRRVKYPLVPGRFAVGLVADDGEGTPFPKNARVLLHSYLPAEERGAEKRNFSEDDFLIPGITTDGYLRDFVFTSEDNITLLPDSVNDEKALLLYHVAIAQATVDTLDVKRGEHIAVIGADLAGLLVCRLLIYRQASPILIDSDRERLEFARTRGVYYTSPIDDSLMDFIGTVTGGRLADGVVFVASAGETDLSLPVKICAPEKHLAFCGVGGEGLVLDINAAMRKRLTVHGVSDGTDELETAINLVANKALDLSAFRFREHGKNDVAAVLSSLGEPDGRDVDELDVIDLV